VNHPHPDKRNVVCAIRHYLLGEKARRGSARGLGHYHDLLQTYLTAKRLTPTLKGIGGRILTNGRRPTRSGARSFLILSRSWQKCLGRKHVERPLAGGCSIKTVNEGIDSRRIAMHTDNRQFTKQYQDCIAACWSCATICNTCSDDMIHMENNKTEELMALCIRMCRECADMCALSAQWMSRLSPLTDQICAFCAEICDACAETCERHASHHSLCADCAQECRRCASLCREMEEVRAS
jgi:hypothetical protein